jgi:predicted phage-related endonuclease
MSKNEIVSKIEAIRELEELIAEATTEAEALRDSIKAEMLDRGTEELTAGAYIVRWTSILTNRFDSTAFKREHSDLYKTFTKQIASRRFTISA